MSNSRVLYATTSQPSGTRNTETEKRTSALLMRPSRKKLSVVPAMALFKFHSTTAGCAWQACMGVSPISYLIQRAGHISEHCTIKHPNQCIDAPGHCQLHCQMRPHRQHRLQGTEDVGIPRTTVMLLATTSVRDTPIKAREYCTFIEMVSTRDE